MIQREEKVWRSHARNWLSDSGRKVARRTMELGHLMDHELEIDKDKIRIAIVQDQGIELTIEL